MSFLTWRQYRFLTQPLDPQRVGRVRGHDHLEQWDVRRFLVRVFGFGGWSFERIDCHLIAQIEHPNPSGNPKWTVIYRYEGRLTVRGADGTVAVYEDAAVADAQNQPSLGDAHDQALKSAASGALKRCAVNWGDQFGLGLYSNQPDPVVRWSLVRPAEPEEAMEKRDDGPTATD